MNRAAGGMSSVSRHCSGCRPTNNFASRLGARWRRRARRAAKAGLPGDRWPQQPPAIMADGQRQGGTGRQCGREPVILSPSRIAVPPVGRAHGRSHAGATMASLFRACRIVSPTTSRRFRARTAARTWVESVRCRPLAFTSWRSRHHVSKVSKSRYSAAPAISRVRNSLRTEASNPGSVSSRRRRYFQSMRLCTASAAGDRGVLRQIAGW